MKRLQEAGATDVQENLPLQTVNASDQNLPSWSDFPKVMLQEIFRKLDLVNRIRFRGVCKNWNSVDGVGAQFPWLLQYDNLCSCKFFDPLLNRKYYSLSESTYTIGNPNSKLNGWIQLVITSKKGWLLCQSLDLCRTLSKVFLYNPFTKDLIEFPPERFPNFVATFSETPSSSDCIVFATECFPINQFNIRTIRCGDAYWNCYRFHISELAHCVSMIYLNGNLYCLFSSGTLVIFDTSNHELVCLISRPSEISIDNPKLFLIESDGEVLLICCNSDIFKKIKEDAHFLMFKFDGLRREWSNVMQLKNKAIFLDYCTSNGYAISCERETRDLANMIYLNCRETTWCYSLKIGLFRLWPEWLPMGGWYKTWIDPPEDHSKLEGVGHH